MATKTKTKVTGKRHDAGDDDDDLPDIVPASSITSKPLNVALYGRSGSGKTTFACSFPKPMLLIDCKDEGEDSVKDIKGLSVARVKTWEEFEALYWYLKKNKKGYKTVAIDTVTNLQEMAIRFVLEEANKDPEKAGEWGVMTKKEWGSVASMLKEAIMNWRDLKLNVVFIAQERVFNLGEENDDAEGELMPEVGPRIMPSVGNTLNAAVDVIGNTFVREEFVKVKDKSSGLKKTKRKVQYCLRIGPHAYYTTKIRKPKSMIAPAHLVDPVYEDLEDLRNGKFE